MKGLGKVVCLKGVEETLLLDDCWGSYTEWPPKPSNQPRRSGLWGCQCDTGRVRGQRQVAYGRSPITFIFFEHHIYYTSDRLWVEEKVDPRVDEVQRSISDKIFLGSHLHNPNVCLCAEDMSQCAARSR